MTAEIPDECSAKTQSSIAVNLLLCKYVFCRFVLIREIYFSNYEKHFSTHIYRHTFSSFSSESKQMGMLFGARALVRARDLVIHYS